MRLDTHPSRMVGAVALYRSLGFVETRPYYRSPIPATAYYALRLRDLAQEPGGGVGAGAPTLAPSP